MLEQLRLLNWVLMFFRWNLLSVELAQLFHRQSVLSVQQFQLAHQSELVVETELVPRKRNHSKWPERVCCRQCINEFLFCIWFRPTVTTPWTPWPYVYLESMPTYKLIFITFFSIPAERKWKLELSQTFINLLKINNYQRENWTSTYIQQIGKSRKSNKRHYHQLMS